MTSLHELSHIEECQYKKQIVKRIMFPQISKSPSTFLVFPKDRNNEPNVKLETFRKDFFTICWTFLLSQQEFVIFFEKPDFQGKLYFLPLRPFIYEDKASPQTVFEQKMHNFIHHFRFFYRQTFSCVIPENYRLIFTSYDKNEQIFEILEGKHPHIFFGIKSSVQKIQLSNKNKIK